MFKEKKTEGYTPMGPNAYGELVSVEGDGTELPVICGCHGSMWLCRPCKEIALLKQKIKKLDKLFFKNQDGI